MQTSPRFLICVDMIKKMEVFRPYVKRKIPRIVPVAVDGLFAFFLFCHLDPTSDGEIRVPHVDSWSCSVRVIFAEPD